ncbi:MAG: hypothetical protein ABEJ58_07375 [Halodesulfurarchaeum sp.]
MAESAEEGDAFVGVEGSAATWAIARADEYDLEPEEFLERVLAAFRSAESSVESTGSDAEGDRSSVESRVEELEADVNEMIEDVRNRVVQVKRETDEKAPADHDHETLETAIDDIREDLDALDSTIQDLQTTVDRGFDNFEEILEYLIAQSEETTDHVETLGTAVLDLRKRVSTVATREQRRAAADRLKEAAARRGVRRAKCDACGTTIDLGLLTRPSCPTCDATFQELDPNPGFFGTSVLLTGDRPALEGSSEAPSADQIETVVDAAGEALGDVEDIRSSISQVEDGPGKEGGPGNDG